MIASLQLKCLLIAIILGIACAQRIPRPHRGTTRGTTTKKPTLDEISDDCPEPDGFFADAEQCDKYYACNGGKISERLCPDGMVFNDFDTAQEKCDLPYNIDCSGRPKLQKPQPTLNCPRQNGYFAHEDESICNKFFYCVDGKFNMIECPAGLVFNPKVGICTWADEAKRVGCGTKEVFNFNCPKVNETFGLTHPRYADPEDCQYFYVCINGDTPRRSGCKLGQVFDDVGKNCKWAREVPECADFYKGQLTDEQLAELENPPTPKPTKKRGSTASSRRRPSKQPRRPVVEEEEEEEVEE
ncbi:protein obstructor-E-like [Culicoides brevitarsis]|uniref:protein obstructor-E-like n=1 Tax=Culicoides brevitarsis TaxID=469753 RepID=UPI00307CB4A4